jgi:GAF domain
MGTESDLSRDTESKSGLKSFTKDVFYEAVVSVTAEALKWAGVVLLLAGVGLFFVGWQLPAWTLVLALIPAVLLTYLAKRAGGREAAELRPRLEAAEDRLDRHDSYGENICSIMDNYQRVLAGDIKGVGVADFIERGILTAGREVMQENGHASDLRMSVLIASDDDFEMWWASGHSMQGQKKYKQPIQKTVSRIALEKKALQVWKNVPAEERDFKENPHATRRFRSMVSIPLLVGDRAMGVFNVVTERRDAFDPADVNYLTSLGGVIQTAVGVSLKVAEPKPKLAATVPAVAGGRLVPPVGAKPAPRGGVDSALSPDGEEAKDD